MKGHLTELAADLAPAEKKAQVVVVGAPELQYSLPSGHASFAMLLAAGLWPAFTRPGRLVLTVFVLWVGLSRISLGAHFPADVAAGYLSSLLLVLGVRAAVQRLQRLG
jgi:membrane-associated phospholipid phosphatase